MIPVLGNKVTHWRLLFEGEVMVIMCMVGWVKVALELHKRAIADGCRKENKS